MARVVSTYSFDDLPQYVSMQNFSIRIGVCGPCAAAVPSATNDQSSRASELKSSRFLILIVGFDDSIQCAEFILRVGLVKAIKETGKGTARGTEYVNAVESRQPFGYMAVKSNLTGESYS